MTAIHTQQQQRQNQRQDNRQYNVHVQGEPK